MSRFETEFPKDARQQEIEQILNFAKKGKSVQLISVFGAGRSTVIRLLNFNPAVRTLHLGEDEKNYLFLYLNFAEIASPEDLYKLIFFFLKERVKEIPTLSDSIHKLYQEAKEAKDQAIFFQILKKAFEKLEKEGFTVVLLFDRFSEFQSLITEDLFANLRSLRNALNGRLSVVFSTHKPIEKFPNTSLWKHFYEFVVGNHAYLNMHDTHTTSSRILLLEKERKKKLPDEVKEMILKITGGHGKLTKLAAEIALDEPEKKLRTDNELIAFLLSHALIKTALFEIWYGLSDEEKQLLKNGQTNDNLKNLGLPFPLLSEYIKQGFGEKTTPKTIRIHENELFLDDDTINDLTGQEFKLLSFLVKNPNRVLSRDEIIQAVWSDTKTQEGVSNEALDQMIFRLRKKIEDEPDNPKHVITIKGRGFRFLP